jgi:hypothetical protein
VEQNDEPWPTSISAYHDTGDPDRDCAGRVAGSPPRGAGVRRADRQQSNRYTASYCRVANHTSSNPVGHDDAGCNDHANHGANSGSNAPSKRDGDSNSDASTDSNSDARSDAHRDEGANRISNQDRERNSSADDDSANDDPANGDPDCDTVSQSNAHNGANPGKHPDAHSATHPATKRKREGDTGACAGGLDEHHI